MYIDDLLLIAQTTEALNQMINELNKFLQSNFAIVNLQKTRIMARFNTTQMNKWFKNNPIEQATMSNSINLKYLGITINMNNNWDQHITNVIKKAKQRFYMLQKQGVQWKQLDPLSCIHLIKTIISPILHYGVEIMDLNKKQTTQIDKTIANMLKRTLNLSTFTPTSWILWETNHQNTTEITSQRNVKNSMAAFFCFKGLKEASFTKSRYFY